MITSMNNAIPERFFYVPDNPSYNRKKYYVRERQWNINLRGGRGFPNIPNFQIWEIWILRVWEATGISNVEAMGKYRIQTSKPGCTRTPKLPNLESPNVSNFPTTNELNPRHKASKKSKKTVH